MECFKDQLLLGGTVIPIFSTDIAADCMQKADTWQRDVIMHTSGKCIYLSDEKRPHAFLVCFVSKGIVDVVDVI